MPSVAQVLCGFLNRTYGVRTSVSAFFSFSLLLFPLQLMATIQSVVTGQAPITPQEENE